MEAFLDIVRRTAANRVPDPAGCVLEIGPGTGEWLRELFRTRRPGSVWTVDAEPHHLAAEARGLPANHVRADGRWLSFRRSVFDVVVCVNVASVLPHGGLRQIIHQMQWSLRPGGRGIVSVQNRGNPVLYGRMIRQPRRYSSDDRPFAYRVSDVQRWIRAAGGKSIQTVPVAFGVPVYGRSARLIQFQRVVTAIHFHTINRHSSFSPVQILSWDA